VGTAFRSAAWHSGKLQVNSPTVLPKSISHGLARPIALNDVDIGVTDGAVKSDRQQ
jgi:hypothetical protein